MADTRRAKNRRAGPSFVALPHSCLEHSNWTRLTSHAVKLFIDVYREYKGTNNGDLSATWSVLRDQCHWKSKETLALALDELRHYGWLVVTRPGEALNKVATLYAVTFKSIDHRDGQKLKKPEPPPSCWREESPKWERPEWYTRRKKKNSQVRQASPIDTHGVPKRLQ